MQEVNTTAEAVASCLGEAGRTLRGQGLDSLTVRIWESPTPTQHAKTRWIEGFLLRVAFITVGGTGRKTGGYMYNGRVIFGLRKRGSRSRRSWPAEHRPTSNEQPPQDSDLRSTLRGTTR